MNIISWFLTTHQIPFYVLNKPFYLNLFTTLWDRLYYHLCIDWNLKILSNFPKSKSSAKLRLKLNHFGLKIPTFLPLNTSICLFWMVELPAVSDFTPGEAWYRAVLVLQRWSESRDVSPAWKLSPCAYLLGDRLLFMRFSYSKFFYNEVSWEIIILWLKSIFRKLNVSDH